MAQDDRNQTKQDKFDENQFSMAGWHAPVRMDRQEIRTALEQLHLVGRRIDQMRLIGADRQNTYVSRQANHRCVRSGYAHIAPDAPMQRLARITEPLMIGFADRDWLEILAPGENQFQFSMKRISWWIEMGRDLPNVEADALFAPCAGQQITAVELGGDAPACTRITLRLENGTGLQFAGGPDGCRVACVDAQNHILQTDFARGQAALYNWEDLHWDPGIDFAADSQTIYFGEKGADRTAEPYMTLYAEQREDHKLYISTIDDFCVLDWSMTLVLGEIFDEYGHYQLTEAQWNRILETAAQLLAPDTFDGMYNILYDALPDQPDAHLYLVRSLNANGVVVWNRREKYKKQLADLQAWTDRVLAPGDTLMMYGF